MKGVRLHRALIVVLVLLLGSCERDPTKPGFEIPIMSDMKRSLAAEPYTKYEAFENGMTMQMPVAGTVHRGALLSEEDRKELIKSPESLSRGKHMYETYCQVCHGATGQGDGPLIPKYPNPPALDSKKVARMTAEEMVQVIVEGKRDMPAHAGQIEPSDRWMLVHYIQTKFQQGKTKD